jgi:hypothetical protein
MVESGAELRRGRANFSVLICCYEMPKAKKIVKNEDAPAPLGSTTAPKERKPLRPYFLDDLGQVWIC